MSPATPAGSDEGAPYPVSVTDSTALDDRLRLLSFATAEKRLDYLRVLRAFDHARSGYVVLLHAGDVAGILARTEPDAALVAADIGPLLEQLHAWGVLERSYDGSRAATLAEYRNRHYVYQFGQVGYHAYRAVEDVVAARVDDAALSRLALPDLLADLAGLAAANRAGDADRVHRTLRRLESALDDMATRAAHFYLSLGDLVRTTDATPASFLAHKDALLAHMREFSSDLARYAPKLAAAITAVEESGTEAMLDRAADSDERVFLSRDDRRADRAARWAGLVHWFSAEDGTAEVDRLREGTTIAIAAVLSLLRRVTESRRTGVSRESQLRHLAGWFAAAPTEDAAHALFDATFGLGRPRHLSMAHPDAEVIPDHRSWWDAPPVEIARTLAETGRAPAAGAPARVHRNDAGLRRLRDRQLDAQRRRSEAAAALGAGVDGRVLGPEETDVLLSLLDAALGARVPVSGRIAATTGTEGATFLTLAPHERSTVVRTHRGVLHLDKLAVTVARRERGGAR